MNEVASGLAVVPASAVLSGRHGDHALREAVSEFTALVGRDAFPCPYATMALKHDSLLFSHLAWDGHPARPAELAGAVREYLALLVDEPPAKAAMIVLVVFVDVPDVDGAGSLEPVAWEAVQALVDIGSPAAGGDPDDPAWALVFDGVPLFVNISSPEHRLRRSRNLGNRLALVIQPRDGIDFVAPANERGDRIRESVRRRIDAYDAIPRSPDLSTHGRDDNRDWKQYWLVDDPAGRQGTCPLHGTVDAAAPGG